MTAKRILVVDDEPTVLKSCVRTLQLENFSVQGATGGAEAIALYQREGFDLALVDLMMPDVDGLQVLATLKEHDPTAAVVIFTAFGTKENAVEALRLGACEFLEKPLSTKALVTTVRRILEKEKESGTAVRGNLNTMSLPNIVQINCAEHNQARLRLRQGGQEASLFFADGNVVHAALGPRVGEEVVYELLTWENGEFELEMNIPPPEQTITTSWSGLLLEGMRRIDEKSAGLEGQDRPKENVEYKEVNKVAKLGDLCKEMAGEIPGFVSADVVGMDGLSVAHHAVDPNFDAEMACAQFALVMKLAQKSVDQVQAGRLEDNLVTGKKSYFLSRFLGDGSYYLSVAVEREAASLGNVRLMMRQYADDLWDAIPKQK